MFGALVTTLAAPKETLELSLTREDALAIAARALPGAA